MSQDMIRLHLLFGLEKPLCTRSLFILALRDLLQDPRVAEHPFTIRHLFYRYEELYLCMFAIYESSLRLQALETMAKSSDFANLLFLHPLAGVALPVNGQNLVLWLPCAQLERLKAAHEAGYGGTSSDEMLLAACQCGVALEAMARSAHIV